MQISYSLHLIIILLSIHIYPSAAQVNIKSSLETAYVISGKDSLKRYQFSSSYDRLGRLINQKKFLYNVKNSALIKEEIKIFDSISNILTERIIRYPAGNSPTQQKLQTAYLQYSKNSKDNKRLWRKMWDDFGDLEKEDTLSYDLDSNLIEKCSYDYRGNTSLYCNDYTYNKFNKLCRWRTYYKWTTIDGKGEVANKSAKRRDYRYKYSKNGLLKRSYGTYYLNKFRQRLRYNKDKSLRDDFTIAVKKTTKKDPDSGRSKTTKSIEKKWLIYKQGQVVHEFYVHQKDTVRATQKIFENGLLMQEKQFKNSSLSERFINDYKDGKITTMTHIKYDGKARERYRIITAFNANEQPIVEEQKAGNKQISLLKYQYNTEGLLLSKSLSLNNGKNLEKTIYIYELY